MASLVDIDALRKDFKVAERCEDCQQRHCNADVVFSRRDVCGILDDAPVIDAEPVRHGMWIYHPEAAWKYECSECGCYYPGEWNFCANCGAKMDGDSDAG